MVWSGRGNCRFRDLPNANLAAAGRDLHTPSAAATAHYSTLFRRMHVPSLAPHGRARPCFLRSGTLLPLGRGCLRSRPWPPFLKRCGLFTNGFGCSVLQAVEVFVKGAEGWRRLIFRLATGLMPDSWSDLLLLSSAKCRHFQIHSWNSRSQMLLKHLSFFKRNAHRHFTRTHSLL